MLTHSTRQVGQVTVIRVAGRIVTGEASDSLRDHVQYVLHDRRWLVLNLGDVSFVDSTGLGTIVRLLSLTRQARGDLKLCNLPPGVQKLLTITTTYKLFDTHETEEKAIEAFYTGSIPDPEHVRKGPPVICIHRNPDVQAYLRELLRKAGYDVQTATTMRDARVLVRVTRPALVVVEQEATTDPDRKAAFESACAGLPCIVLDSDFSTQHAAEAATSLLERIAQVAPTAGPA